MPRYTKQDKDGRYYIESENGKLESDTKGHTYGEAIDRFAELEADVVPRSEVERLTIELEAMRGAENSYKLHYEKAKQEVAEQIFGEIEKSIADLEYKANTPRTTVRIDELKAQVNWVLHEVIPQMIAELKKKYIGE